MVPLLYPDHDDFWMGLVELAKGLHLWAIFMAAKNLAIFNSFGLHNSVECYCVQWVLYQVEKTLSLDDRNILSRAHRSNQEFE